MAIGTFVARLGGLKLELSEVAGVGPAFRAGHIHIHVSVVLVDRGGSLAFEVRPDYTAVSRAPFFSDQPITVELTVSFFGLVAFTLSNFRVTHRAV